MKSSRLLIGLVILAYVISLVAIPFLPDQVAVHWNAAGEVDGYGNKWIGAFFGPIVLTFLLLLLTLLPKVDPKKANYEKFKGSYLVMMNALVLLLFFIHVGTLAYNLGYPIDISLIVQVGIGILFIILGNYMPKFKHNYFVGIRTPWTLANETVWNKTHRIGGKVFVIIGLMSILTIFLEGSWRFVIFISVTLLGTVYVFVKSYIYFKEEQNK
jgi:uncharacterized membrane protein